MKTALIARRTRVAQRTKTIPKSKEQQNEPRDGPARIGPKRTALAPSKEQQDGPRDGPARNGPKGRT